MLLRSKQETRRKPPKINYNKLLKLYFESWSQIVKAKLFSETGKKIYICIRYQNRPEKENLREREKFHIL